MLLFPDAKPPISLRVMVLADDDPRLVFPYEPYGRGRFCLRTYCFSEARPVLFASSSLLADPHALGDAMAETLGVIREFWRLDAAIQGLALTPTPTPTPFAGTPTPVPTPRGPRPNVLPAGQRTGEPLVDSLLELFESEDLDGVMARIRFVPVACVKVDERNSVHPNPLCGPDRDEGTLIPSIWVGGCPEGGVATSESIRPSLSAQLSDFGLLGVFERKAGAGPFAGEDDWRWLVLIAQEPWYGNWLALPLDAEGQVLRFAQQCGQLFEEEEALGQALIAPVIR
jgi:hypothetical protein